MTDERIDCSMIRLELAGIPVLVKTRFPETTRYFGSWCKATQENDRESPLIHVDDGFWERYSNAMKEKFPGAYTEFYLQTFKASAALLPFRRCMFHGVAFLWHDRAWLISGESGVGKTTQWHLWSRLFGEEVEMINGDKPAIECREDGTVWVHPSPWNGKENYSGSASGELAGIIYLRQADHNEMNRLSVRDAMIPIYRQFLFMAETTEKIEAAGRMLDMILRKIPVWELSNQGDEASAELTHSNLLTYLEETNGKV